MSGWLEAAGSGWERFAEWEVVDKWLPASVAGICIDFDHSGGTVIPFDWTEEGEEEEEEEEAIGEEEGAMPMLFGVAPVAGREEEDSVEIWLIEGPGLDADRLLCG